MLIEREGNEVKLIPVTAEDGFVLGQFFHDAIHDGLIVECSNAVREPSVTLTVMRRPGPKKKPQQPPEETPPKQPLPEDTLAQNGNESAA